MKKNNNKGFSLVELIVVVLILGILAVAVSPQIMGWVNKSNIAKDESYAGTVATAIESVALEYIGKNWADAIPVKVEIRPSASGSTTPVMTGNDGSADVAVPGTDPKTPGTTPDEQGFMFDLNVMIGDDKLALPSQTGRTAFEFTIDLNRTTGTVTIDAVATN